MTESISYQGCPGIGDDNIFMTDTLGDAGISSKLKGLARKRLTAFARVFSCNRFLLILPIVIEFNGPDFLDWQEQIL